MITVRLSEDARRVVIEAPEIAEVVVGAVAGWYVEDPGGVGEDLEGLATRQRAYEGLAAIEELHDLPEHVVEGACAARDAARESFVDSLAGPLGFGVTKDDARRLAADLLRCADGASSARTP